MNQNQIKQEIIFDRNKCPKCGSSSVSWDEKKQKLICEYCFTEYDAEKIIETENDVEKLTNKTKTIGAQDVKLFPNIITVKCENCGAEISMNHNEISTIKCYWCHSTLSLNSKQENGMIPDMILPFSISKEEAQKLIMKYMSKRSILAESKYKKQFTTDDIVGLYLPYILIDTNAQVELEGIGEQEIRSYMRGIEDDRHPEYDINIYKIIRNFDMTVDDLAIESNENRTKQKNKSNNIIQAILPYDTENSVKFQESYLNGYLAESRNINTTSMEYLVERKILDIARNSMLEDIKKYDRGVKWTKEKIKVIGQKWSAIYLPIWFYIYQDKSNNTYYIALNGRTKKIVGNIPISKQKLIIASILYFMALMLISVPIVLLLGKKVTTITNEETNYSLIVSIFLFIISTLFAICFYFNKKRKYSSILARFEYEKETKHSIKNIVREEELLTTKKGIRESHMVDANYKNIEGEKY